MKDPLPDQLTWNGVTVYGTIDVGYAYQTHGVAASSALATGLEDNIYASKNAKGSVSTLNNNGLSQSTIGVKIEEGIGLGWTAIGKVETGFNPLWGELSDGCQSVLRNAGLNQVQQTVAQGDASRCGQAFNGEVYAGISNAGYGTLTLGRQNALALNQSVAYDPMGGSYAFSIIGYTGTFAGGSGVTEDARWDDSIKYVYQYGPAHAAVMYSDGGDATGMFNGGYAGNIGVTWRGFSFDATYTKENGAVAVTGATYPNLTGAISDNTSYMLSGKYVWDLGGGWKDEGPGSKVTFYGGWAHTSDADGSGGPNDYPLNAHVLGGYAFAVSATTVNTYETAKVYDLEWAGAKYEMGPWALTGAYYHISQGSFITDSSLAGNHSNCAAVTAYNKAHLGVTAFGNTVGSNCSGDYNMVSGLVDYTFNKHFDVYAGVGFSEVSGGLASGFLNDNTTLFMTGMRLKF